MSTFRCRETSNWATIVYGHNFFLSADFDEQIDPELLYRI